MLKTAFLLGNLYRSVCFKVQENFIYVCKQNWQLFRFTCLSYTSLAFQLNGGALYNEEFLTVKLYFGQN